MRHTAGQYAHRHTWRCRTSDGSTAPNWALCQPRVECCSCLLRTTSAHKVACRGTHQVSRMVTVLSGSMSEPGTHASGQCMRYMSRYSQPRSLMDCWQDALKKGKEPSTC